jgi:protein TonB
VEITATPPEKTVADDEFQQSGYALNFASPQATGKGTPGGGGTPSPSTAPKNMSKMRRLSSAMAALVVLLAATWAIRSAMQDPVVKQWDQTVANNTKEDYENFVDSYPASEQAAIARHRLDSIETAAWESALASNDTTRIHDYLNQYPEGRYFTDAMLALEKRRKPQVKEIIFCWQMLDTLLKITHEGGFAPYRFTFMQNGKAIRELPRDSIGFFTIPLKDLLPGAYEVWLQDAEGRAISDSLTVAPAKPPISETGKKKKTPTGISKKKPPTKKTGTGTQPPAISTPPPKPEEPKVEEPAKPATDPNNDKPVPMRSAARLPVYPGCEKSNKNKEEKCTERRIRDFLNDRVNYPDAAMRKRIQGTVNVFFTIERDGSVTEVQAGNDIGGGCAEEASRVVSQLPKFKPGQNSKGEPIRIRYTLPVTFRLN